ncbi:MAG TPA: class I SAM-dependent methyltransferase [Candidatus Limnocylindrales bacterium]|nr:class I SAM-dependent methyltransferase [Candidatus Limnocylindrales bacterium]
MLASARRQFLDDYIKIRHAEGRGSHDSAYYLALPFRDITGRLQDQWNIRAKSFRYLERRVLPRMEKRIARPLRIADLGAGNCWLSYRMALRGHQPLAVDILTDSLDGLAAGRHYQAETPFPRINAEFDDLPFAAGSVDLAIYNASIHYSADYRRTLTEIRRCLSPEGCFTIIDSPVYRLHQHGEAMVRERHKNFQKTYGFPSDTLPSIEYFDLQMLDELARDLGISWTIDRPWYGWQWAMRPWKARWHKQRPPSNFWILTGRFRP